MKVQYPKKTRFDALHPGDVFEVFLDPSDGYHGYTDAFILLEDRGAASLTDGTIIDLPAESEVDFCPEAFMILKPEK